MCPVPFVFVLFLEQALERASLAGWQRGIAVSLHGHLRALWILLVMEHHRHLSGEQSEVCAMQHLDTWSSGAFCTEIVLNGLGGSGRRRQ